ncbi:hypothetical protein N7475_008204 [Penicillium sp. IBT 31633x]|nr:hypothetical protein N7475_008204 [Penicillium sp. IBT 31633x]
MVIGPTLDHDKLYQELLAREEKRRKEREAAGIPEPDTVNVDFSSTDSKVQLLTKGDYSTHHEPEETQHPG